MDRRSTLLVMLLSLLFVVSAAFPANAASTGWDRNDVGGGMDLRWVGVYLQDADTVRISVTLWDPVRDWMLPVDPYSGSQLYITATHLFELKIYGQGYFHKWESGEWVVEWVDAGSGQPFRHPFRAAHPNPYTFLVWLPAELFSSGEISVFSCDSATAFETLPCYPSQGFHDQIEVAGLDSTR
jgi:hypothetical protein